MKKIFKLSLFALFAVMVSCDDATDIIQESELDETKAYRTVDDLQSGMLGVMSAYAPDAAANGDGDAILFNDLFTDNFKRGAASSGQGNQEYSFILQPNSSFAISIWGNRYATINFANRVLRAWDRIFPELTDENDIERANHIRGQVLAMRALCHLDLFQYYTPEYQNPASPSVIIMNFVPEITEVFPRNTAGEVSEFINADLTEAATLLEDMPAAVFAAETGFADTDFVFFPNRDMVKATNARAALVQGNYALAQTLAEELLVDYPLSPIGIPGSPSEGEYLDLFLDEEAAGTELIFGLSRVTGDAAAVGLYYANDPAPDGSPFYEAANGLYNLYSNNDIRRKVNFLLDGDNVNSELLQAEPGQILIGKYRGSADGPRINDIKIFRGSEMKLIIAECQARAGNFAGAAATVRELRNERLVTGTAPLPDYQGNLGVALADILLERRKEFAFEGHRYLDLKRLGTELGIGISRNEIDCASFSAPSCELPAGDYRFTLPIPRTEVAPNPSIEQNPGYSN